MNGQYSQILMIGLLAAAFWFLLIRPQQQRAKKQNEMIESLQPGADIVTIGGIYGQVVELGERVRIRVFDGSEIEIARAAVARVLPAEEVDAPDADDDADADTDADTGADTDASDAPDAVADPAEETAHGAGVSEEDGA